MWLEWEPWQDCSTTCGGGTRLRERECEGPFYDGAECVGPYNDTEVCGTDPCPSMYICIGVFMNFNCRVRLFFNKSLLTFSMVAKEQPHYCCCSSSSCSS